MGAFFLSENWKCFIFENVEMRYFEYFQSLPPSSLSFAERSCKINTNHKLFNPGKFSFHQKDTSSHQCPRTSPVCFRPSCRDLVLSSEHPSKIPQTTTHTLPPFRLYPCSSSPDALSALIVPQCPFLHCAFYSCLLSLVFWAWVSPWPACLHGYTRSTPQVKAASITRLGKVSFSKFPMFCRLIRKLVQHRCCTASSMLGFCFDSQKTFILDSAILPLFSSIQLNQPETQSLSKANNMKSAWAMQADPLSTCSASNKNRTFKKPNPTTLQLVFWPLQLPEEFALRHGMGSVRRDVLWGKLDWCKSDF